MEKLNEEERDLLESALKRYIYELRRSAVSERRYDDPTGEKNANSLEARANATQALHDKLLKGGA